jgi:hypothetical protein
VKVQEGDSRLVHWRDYRHNVELGVDRFLKLNSFRKVDRLVGASVFRQQIRAPFRNLGLLFGGHPLDFSGGRSGECFQPFPFRNERHAGQ